jgi:UDP-arabinose 4-epimerase
MGRPDRTTILVTGGAGYIGSHTCKALAAKGFVPVTYDNLSCGHRWAVRWGPFIQGDLADVVLLETVLREYNIKAVIHFAAFAYVGESMRDPGKYFQNNIVNSLNLLQAMQKAGIDRLVFSSSCATYGIPDELPINESHRQAPVNPYGESKLFVERALHWYDQAHELRSMALRYFNAAGADPEGEIGEEHDPETHLVPLVIQAALGRRSSIEIFGVDYPTKDGTAVRDYVHVTDLANAHVAALGYLISGGSSDVINLGTGHGYSVKEVISAVEDIAGRRVPAISANRRLGDPPELIADAAKARSIIQWIPQYSALETIVETAWRWTESAKFCVSDEPKATSGRSLARSATAAMGRMDCRRDDNSDSAY